MTLENWLVLAILAGAVILFTTDRIRVDLVALMVLVLLVLTGLLTVEQALSGFASPAVVTVWAVFIISGGLVYSGVADRIAAAMLRVAGKNPVRLLVILMVTVGLMSAVMNNIGAVAILLPAVVSLARQLHLPPSKLLMPLAFAALLGGNMTLIGTPPNILAASILEDYGRVDGFAFFDFLPMGIVVLTAGILYMVFIGRHLLPDRNPGGELADAYPIREYLTELRVGPRSPLLGKTVSEGAFGAQYDLNVLQVRNGRELVEPVTAHRLNANEVLLVEGGVDEILAASRDNDLQLVQDWRADQWHPEEMPGGLELAEITVAPRSRHVGHTLKEVDFRARYGLSVLALRHDGRAIITHLGDVPLSFGDSLMVQGPPEKINLLRGDPNFMLLAPPKVELRRTEKAPLAVGILVVALLAVTLGGFSVAITLLAGAILMVLAGVLSMDEAYRAIDWQSVFLIAGMLPLGIAMEVTGTARLLADQLVLLVGGWGPLAVLAGIFVLTALLTEVISNAAATVLVVPIAIDAAFGLQVSPQTFVMATVIAASTSFLMPVGHQVNIIIYGPGGYRFGDYARVGVGLNLLVLVLVVTVLPLIWPL